MIRQWAVQNLDSVWAGDSFVVLQSHFIPRGSIITLVEKSDYDALLKQAEAMAEGLNWIGAIRVAPKKSWPTHEIIAQVANEALEKYHGGK